MPPSIPAVGARYGAQYITVNHGGGLIRINAQYYVTINGTVSANGAAGNSPVNRGAGGAGGTIFIQCAQFSGNTNAILRADGGLGGTEAGGGGGGRIAVWVYIPDSRKQALAAGSNNLMNIIITNAYAKYLGIVSVTNGLGYTNLPPNGATSGSIVFAVYKPAYGILMSIR